MSKALVAFFSASGVTKEAAKKLAQAVNGDLFEILPKNPYTSEDLDWTNKQSRSSIEMNDPNSRPEILDNAVNIGDYDIIFLGFPVWWYREPGIIDTFLEAHDFTGKTIVPFCTSGGSGIGDTGLRIAEIVKHTATVDKGVKLSARVTVEELKEKISEFIK